MADKEGWNKALYDLAKHEALRARGPGLGMAGKADPRAITERFSTDELRRRIGA